MLEPRLVVHGYVDLSTAPKLREALQRAVSSHVEDVVLDCEDMPFIDSTGIRVLVEVHADLQAQGRRLVLVKVQRAPRRVFEILCITEMLRSDDDSVSANG